MKISKLSSIQLILIAEWQRLKCFCFHNILIAWATLLIVRRTCGVRRILPSSYKDLVSTYLYSCIFLLVFKNWKKKNFVLMLWLLLLLLTMIIKSKRLTLFWKKFSTFEAPINQIVANEPDQCHKNTEIDQVVQLDIELALKVHMPIFSSMSSERGYLKRMIYELFNRSRIFHFTHATIARWNVKMLSDRDRYEPANAWNAIRYLNQFMPMTPLESWTTIHRHQWVLSENGLKVRIVIAYDWPNIPIQF